MKLTIDINDDTIQGAAAILKMQSSNECKEEINKAVERTIAEPIEITEDYIKALYEKDAQNLIMALAMSAIAKAGEKD